MKKLIVLGLVFLVLGAANLAAQETQWQEIGSGNTDFNCVLVNSDDQHVILTAAKNEVLKTQDGGKNWRRVLSLRQQSKQIRIFSSRSKQSSLIFAATPDGLYLSRNQGNNWKRVFKAKNSFGNECLAAAVFNNQVYLGTNKGLYISKDNCRSWQKQTNGLSGAQILAIAADNANIYLASSHGVFKRNNITNVWEKIFLTGSIENEADELDPQIEEEGGNRTPDIRYLVADFRKQGHLYLAASKGIYESIDAGAIWNALPDYGLFDKDVKLILFSPDSRLFAVTAKGIFAYRDERWHEVSCGLIAQETRWIDFDSKGDIYAACDKGLFKAQVNLPKESSSNLITALYSGNEPVIRQVQEAAIRYAEVSPEKIIRWRKSLSKRAFLPRVSASVNRDTGDLWHWESGSTTKANDDVLMRGRDAIGWDVTLSWDLGDIIFSNEQTSIDTRSKLMVELREDILDEVTKIYFERIRVRMELDNLAIEDRKKRFEKELRLQELTAMLDGLTGGYFSQAVSTRCK